jgi:hypothetical protein
MPKNSELTLTLTQPGLSGVRASALPPGFRPALLLVNNAA